MVSIIILSYNAPLYVYHTLKTLKKTQGCKYETIVLDNNSKNFTKRLLLKLKEKGYIDKLIFENKNTFFAKGNNIASKYCDKNSKYILLLNSDVEIRDKHWLKYLIERHQRGAISYGLCDNYPHIRGDGYCFLIDKDLYERYKLDEQFEWWWSITKLQAQLLNDGYKVIAVKEHETLLHHYGGMSGTSWKNAKGMKIEGEEIKKWFKSGEVKIISKLEGNDRCCRRMNLINLYSEIIKIIKLSLRIPNKIINKILKLKNTGVSI